MSEYADDQSLLARTDPAPASLEGPGDRRNRTALCYVADHEFLLASIASAISFRRFVPPSRAAVIIFVFPDNRIDLGEVDAAVRHLGVDVRCLDPAPLRPVNLSRWNKTHVPVTALGRLFISDYIDSEFDRIIYADGDTIFTGDPSELLTLRIKEDFVAASEDIRSFARDDLGKFGRQTRKYFSSIGVTGAQGYFNSGIMLAGIKTWRSITAEALRFYINNQRVCMFHDQSALNAVAGHRRVPLQLKWNFQTPYKFLGLERSLEPCVCHFTESTKPWLGPIDPWRGPWPQYQLAADLLGSVVVHRSYSVEQVVSVNKWTRQRLIRMWTVFALRNMLKREKVMRYEMNARQLQA